jgi:hypothetical protein
MMRRFANVLKRTVPDPKATNPSKTGYEVSRMVQHTWQALASTLGFATGGPAGGVAANTAASLGPALRSSLKASKAVRGAPRVRQAPILPMVSGAIQTGRAAREGLEQ